jgi:glycosyltransferase involved in cell wall biosynthesis
MSASGPVRLFIDAHVFDNEFQGTRTFLREIYLLLAGREDLELFFAANDIENLKRIFPRRPNVHFIAYKSHSSLRRLAWEIPGLLKKHAIDYAHFQYICPLVKSCKYIVTLHDVIFSEYPDEFSRGYRLAKKFLYKRSAWMADIITTVSTYSQKSIRTFLEVPSHIPIHVVPNGVGPKFYEPHDKQRSGDFIFRKYGMKRFLLYVSRFEPRKNHEFLLRAWIELELYKEGIHLVLLGSRTIPVPAFDRLLGELSPEIRNFVFIHDRIDDSDLLEFYRAADVFVYPSRAEGFGIPPLEAAASGTPVICSNSSAMEQFTFFGENHIDPFNLPSLVDRLKFILRTPPSAEQLSALSREVALSYSWEHSADILYRAIGG